MKYKLHEALAQLKEDGSNYAVNLQMDFDYKINVGAKGSTLFLKKRTFKNWGVLTHGTLPLNGWQIVEVRGE